MLTHIKKPVKTFHILEDGHVTSPKGFTAGGVHTGLRKVALDFGWIHSEIPATAAGVYTLNSFQAAPLKLTKKHVNKTQQIQTVVVNSGNANSCTGEDGYLKAQATAELVAHEKGIDEHLVAIASTGIIGVPLPFEPIKKGIQHLNDPLCQKVTNFERAILTTDIETKHIAVELEIDGKTITIGGAAKGSGMIHPNMATMLGFITTDAAIDNESLEYALKATTNQTFNMITVDGDSSTNDMVLALANGTQGNSLLTKSHPQWTEFLAGFQYVCQVLAKSIARDGEGATKLIEVEVLGAQTVEAARAVAKSVISSNLVKTAMYGSDANWGRIISAIGYSNQKIEPERVHISIGNTVVVEKGVGIPFDEEVVMLTLVKDEVKLLIDLQQSSYTATAWGCDLTYDYIRINSSYRT
ncbi:bifunctional glutamate N-acetyltransferase/amino-acid acetyltransferase ArgJ [Carnobacterium jeotgali]|uniref:bifunctional glutamate N-acetyltransferase/amino-acid acetyltransferase ArgJ n=1 Tax=Carnobacterium jeotgali TaxID=545534 RepID=UPI003890F15B